MGTRAMTTAAAGLLAAAPWLVLLPLDGAAAILAFAGALAAACHGAGWVVARIGGERTLHPLLAIQLGLATLVALAGLASALGVFTLAGQTIVLYGLVAVHTAAVVLDRERLGAWVRSTERGWLAPALLLGALGVLHVLGAAGDLGARPFDDDGHVLAQLQRLRETGTLADPVGYPRTAQLGGQLAIAALASLAGDVHLMRLGEAFGFVAAIALVCARIAPRDRSSTLWALLVVIAAAALAFAPTDPATCWTAVGQIGALFALVSDRIRREDDRVRSLVPIGLIAGALIALRLELAPLAALALVAAWSDRGASRRAHARRLAAVAGIALAVVVPYALVRANAWATVPDAARALIAPSTRPWIGRIGLAAAIALATLPLAALVRRDRAVRGLIGASCLTVAGIASQLTGTLPYAARFLWPVAIAVGSILVIEIARRRRLTAAALIVVVGLFVLVHEGREATGRRRWTRRYIDLAMNIEYLRHARDPEPIAGVYDALLRQIPRGATVAVWVARPERLSYAGPARIVDVRTPRIAKLRTHRWTAHESRIERLLGAVGADFLLLEADDRQQARIRADLTYRLACSRPLPGCADDLEVIARHHRVVAEQGGVQLIRIERPVAGGTK
ncbi:MAG: hypothetical protein ACTHU0_25860 [Kofleriaceae bacterium]